MNVTVRPLVDGFAELASIVVLVNELTTCDSADDVLPACVPSPEYVAVTLCVPTVSVDVVSAAWLEPLSVPVPRSVAPSKKSTVPVAVGETVAVNVTVKPLVDGFAELASVVVVNELTTCDSADDVLPVCVPSPE